MTPLSRLAALLEELPADATLPVGWIREQLALEPLQACANDAATPLAIDLTVNEFGACFGRSGSWARRSCEQCRIPGAYKLGRQWRIPRASVDLFRQAQGAPAPDATRPARAELGAWRRGRKAS